MSEQEFDYEYGEEEDWEDWCECCDNSIDECTCTKYCSDDFHWDIQEEINEWDREQTSFMEAMRWWP